MMKSPTKIGSIRDHFLCMCIVKLVNAFPNLLVFFLRTGLWSHHICASIVCERLDSMKISMTSVPFTRPSLSVSVFLKMSSYLSWSSTDTTQFTAGWNKRETKLRKPRERYFQVKSGIYVLYWLKIKNELHLVTNEENMYYIRYTIKFSQT